MVVYIFKRAKKCEPFDTIFISSPISTMKNSKPAPKKSAQEECGVWLDTAQLKIKAKQKRLARPISKLLNPFLRGEGYNLDVALSFTQTKIEMPKTKQSTISTFFSPQRRVLNKISTSEKPRMGPALPSSSSSVSTTCAFVATPETSGTKRRRETDQEPDLNHGWENENVPDEDVWSEHAADHAADHALSQIMQAKEEFEEIYLPQTKRRLTTTSLLHGDTHHSLEAWSQDPLFTYSQCSEGEFDLNDQESNTTKDLRDPEASFFDSLHSEKAFGLHMDVEATTSTQKSFKQINSSLVDNDKENSRFSPSQSPNKHFKHSRIEPLSNYRCTVPGTKSPLKHSMQQQKKADQENNHDSQFEWKKPRTSPFKKPKLSHKAVDEDSLAMLFTQDSEGFRVIAHRGLQERSPLKDQSNVTNRSVRNSSYKSLVEDDEDEMLFTQDSQGNLVIKH